MAYGERGQAARLRTEPLLPLAGDRRLADLVEEVASQHYPESWVRRSNELGRLWVAGRWLEGSICALLVFVAAAVLGLMRGVPIWFAIISGIVLGAAVGCGYARSFGRRAADQYLRLGGGLILVGWGDGGAELKGAIVHELGHRMQHAVPGLVEEERAFLEAKMGRPLRILPRPVAFLARLVREVAMALGLVKRPSHGIFHPYAAQDPMTGRDYEVFTQGYQAMVYSARNPSTRKLDPNVKPLPDHESFVRRVLREL